MMPIFWRVLLVFGLFGVVAHGAAAQDMLRPAAVVNDEVISMLDLEMRVRLALLSTGRSDTPEVRQRIVSRVMRGLIDERLQAQEAERLDIKVTEDQVSGAVANVASQNQMTADGFIGILERRGILPQAFLDQIRAQLTWQALIARRLRPSVRVTDDEVDDLVARIATNQGRVQSRVSEIFLGVDTAGDDDEVRQSAQRLFEELRAGVEFAALAQEFSESATASSGGDLGWVQEGQLDEELARAVSAMRPGDLSPPIRTLGGYHIIWLRQQREVSVGDVFIDLKQIFFALPQDAPSDKRQEAERQAASVRERISGCDGVEALAGDVGSAGSGDLGTVNLRDLPPAVREAVRSLGIGQPSEPVAVSGGLSVLIVCDRTDTEIDREQIRQQLANERLNLLSRRYMRDLRRSANVDIRI